MKRLWAISILLALACAVPASASVPPMINYQGKLMQPSGAPVPDNTYTMTFAIYDVPTGGTALWSETNPGVQVKGGLFAVLLGSVNNLGPNLFDSPNRWFGVKVGNDPEMTPRQQIASMGFAVKAASAEIATTVPDGAITTAKIAQGAVDSTSVADGAITSTKLAGSAITIGYAKRTEDFATDGVGTLSPVPSLSINVSVPPGGRRLKLSAYAACITTTAPAGTVVGMTIHEGNNALQGYDAPPTTVPGHGAACMPTVIIENPTPGWHTYHVCIIQYYGAGTITLQARNDYPAFILAELI